MVAELLGCDVILADDNADDLDLLRLVLKDTTRFRVVCLARDGGEVIAYLGSKGEFADRRTHPFPDLLILDLKMPRVDGSDVLHWIRKNAISRMAIVVLTGSEDPTDGITARELGADAVFHKPFGLQHVRELVGQVKQFMEAAPKGISCGG